MTSPSEEQESRKLFEQQDSSGNLSDGLQGLHFTRQSSNASMSVSPLSIERGEDPATRAAVEESPLMPDLEHPSASETKVNSSPAASNKGLLPPRPHPQTKFDRYVTSS
jgi:hypothetical protein